MTDDTERARYLRGEITHNDYYGKLVELFGEDTLRTCLPVKRTPEEWRTLVDVDPHLNTVPLYQWDARHELVRALVRSHLNKVVKVTGSRGWSLCDSVSVLKETARRMAR